VLLQVREVGLKGERKSEDAREEKERMLAFSSRPARLRASKSLLNLAPSIPHTRRTTSIKSAPVVSANVEVIPLLTLEAAVLI
jgi:hypothetical protein